MLARTDKEETQGANRDVRALQGNAPMNRARCVGSESRPGALSAGGPQ